MMRFTRLVIVLLAAYAFSLSSAYAEEKILSFNSRIQVQANGLLRVTETIRVNAEGNKIRRGIFRDFPLVFKTDYGATQRVSFDVIQIKRNNQPEDFHIKSKSRVDRVYIGDSNRFLPRGEHTFEITYETDRQIRFFSTHDELYWNVTGNFWDFPIDTVRADITLPPGVRAEDANLFTGRSGATERNASVRFGSDRNTLEFTTTQPLKEREGLTVAVRMPKGSIAAPGITQKTQWFWRDNKPFIIGLGGLILIGLYYFWAWHNVGRDPPAGVIVPRWDSPDDISPALVHYIENRGLSGNTSLSAALLNLAVKGYITLEEFADDITIKIIERTDYASLPVGEQYLYTAFRNRGDSFTIDKANGKEVLRIVTGFRKSLYTEHRNKFFVKNLGYVFAGLAMSALILAMTMSASTGQTEVIFSIVLAIIFSVGITVGTIKVAFKNAYYSGFKGKFSAVKNAFTIVVMILAMGPMFMMGLTELVTQPLMLTVISCTIALNVLFYYLLAAPTPLGRQYLDGIEGLKTYINLAEKDRLNLVGGPGMSHQHFEKILPYAVALNIEEPWSDAFQSWLASAASAVQDNSYSPGWYRGNNFSTRHIGRSVADIGTSLSNSVANSMPAPKSSSSGFSGGGSSGGGGGGGGGGGW